MSSPTKQQMDEAMEIMRKWIEDHRRALIIGGGVIAGAALAPTVIPVVLTGMGFGAGGVASGSLAAFLHSLIGNVAAGSLFATLQSIGAGGAIGLGSILVSMGLGAAVGEAVDRIAPHILNFAQNAILSSNHLAMHLGGALALVQGHFASGAFREAFVKRVKKD